MIERAELTSETRHAPLCGASDEMIGRESVGFTLNLHLHFAADSFLRCRQVMLSTSKLQTSLRILLRTRGQRSPNARSIATTGVAGGTQGPNAYCRDLVLKRDYQAFLTSQTFPEEHRDAVFALRAFYVELATIQESVSSSVIGKMRMQFWRDAVKGFPDGRPPQHPIALALYEAYQKAKLPTYHLKRIIDARDAELHAPTHLTVDSLIAHAESTSSTYLYLLLSLVSLSSSETFSHAASHVGIAQTIATLLHALPFHASQGRMVIPAEITARHSVNQEEVFRKGGNAKGIDDAVFEFATIANDHLITAREMMKETGGKVPVPARPVFVSAVPTALFLERLENLNFDVFDRSLQQRSWTLPWRVWRGVYSGDF
ncbi:hypothetical protein PHLCEN_2v9507 [Hermanssonia centrifuga]|uniref:NADH dehydrogenase (Ubiquinone) complex I, assembly factor 6 n=1 Tax=Hermanssonia centrifuga TaxID=98765 RepID=A0A2R6NQH7_9APHY|nr:hypothetical protein PHLCEN_2v9507 [Hermanssonia centrifuga]